MFHSHKVTYACVYACVITTNHRLCCIAERAFPAIDLLRVTLRNPSANEHLCNADNGPALLEYLTKHIAISSVTQNQIVCLRALANLPSHPAGRELLLSNREMLISLVAQAGDSPNKNVQIAAATVLLNAAVLLQPTHDSAGKIDVLAALAILSAALIDAEAKYRLCIGIGTLVWSGDDCRAAANSMELRPTIDNWSRERELSKLQECASTLKALL